MAWSGVACDSAFAPARLQLTKAESLGRFGQWSGNLDRKRSGTVYMSREIEGESAAGPSRTTLRRRALLSAVMTSMAVAIVGARSEMSFAEEGGKNGRVWGAAELDFRMYVCGATGKFCPAMTKSEIPPARQIDATLAKDLVLIPEQVLQGTFAKRGKLLPQKLEETSAALSESLLPEFQRRVSFDPEDKTDQYALDFDTYIKWKAVASLLPQESDRMLFQRSVGDRVLRALLPAAEPYDAGSDGDMQYSKIRAHCTGAAVTVCGYTYLSPLTPTA
jgi:hypothetical protein